jgi:hypothetical protein
VVSARRGTARHSHRHTVNADILIDILVLL